MFCSYWNLACMRCAVQMPSGRSGQASNIARLLRVELAACCGGGGGSGCVATWLDGLAVSTRGTFVIPASTTAPAPHWSVPYRRITATGWLVSVGRQCMSSLAASWASWTTIRERSRYSTPSMTHCTAVNWRHAAWRRRSWRRRSSAPTVA